MTIVVAVVSLTSVPLSNAGVDHQFSNIGFTTRLGISPVETPVYQGHGSTNSEESLDQRSLVDSIEKPATSPGAHSPAESATYVTNISIPNGPGLMTYDSSNGNLYVGTTVGLTEISSTTQTPVQNISANTDVGVIGPCYDSQANLIYVPLGESPDTNAPGQVLVLSPSSGSLIGSITVGPVPVVAACDSTNGVVYVTDRGNAGETGNELSVILPGGMASTSTIPVGLSPSGLAFGPGNQRLYVANNFYSVDNVTVVSTSSNTSIASIDATSQSPAPDLSLGAITYASSNQDLYVTAPGTGCSGNTVAVVSTVSDSFVTSITVGPCPGWPAYDPANGDVYVPNSAGDNVTIISTASNSVIGSVNLTSAATPTGGGPGAVFYDPSNGYLYVSISSMDTVAVLSGVPSASGSTIATSWDSASDDYSFPNDLPTLGNPATNGNCYGYASTALLYFEHYQLGDLSAPYLPLQAGETSTSSLSLPTVSGNPPVWPLNNVLLAIMLHQSFDPANSFPAVSSEASEYDALVADLKAGDPAILELPPHGSTLGHATVAWAVTESEGGMDQISLYDPNYPQSTETASYDSDTGSFSYSEPSGDSWSEFAVSEPTDIQQNWFFNLAHLYWWPWSSYFIDELSQYWLIGSNTPATVAEGDLTDSFSTSSNSESLQAGIPQSSGIEEGSLQFYSLPSSQPKPTVSDPGTQASSIFLWAQNTSSGVQGYTAATTVSSVSSSWHSVSPTASGISVSTGGSSIELNISFASWGKAGYTFFETANLTIGAAADTVFTVNDWADLNSTTRSFVTAELYHNGSSIPYATYELVSGQTGWGAALGSSTPFYESWWFLSGVAVVLIAVIAVILLIRRSRKSKGPTEPTRPSDVRP